MSDAGIYAVQVWNATMEHWVSIKTGGPLDECIAVANEKANASPFKYRVILVRTEIDVCYETKPKQKGNRIAKS